ncbi:glycogen/starch/alpha-glucan phosphorylase [Desulfatitalea alkaliphila]|uniref:Alpha-1,4 glucan phosphorylase n=1 Tax=Desulfatitalea alkaliphila TaxID=2929485 RepID=A0AA41R4W8_9BACT|nr:glycogen/starch/alpha-glucan phosphorylase [Desulfatitalea alkaliphila]MCJ8501771.1 glycogen/starch/alpha-glucan phosphorylase [Desulfatitalea alkaliphila]
MCPSPTKKEGARSEIAASPARTLKEDILHHICYTLGNDPERPNKYKVYMGLAYAVRDRLIARWIKTQRALYDHLAKRVYFLSLEFLPGRFLKNYLISLRMEEETRETLAEMGFDLDDLEEQEWDAGLGNGGLGRLASCYMDSIACCDLPGYGYGIHYDYGIFHQVIDNGYQREQADNWIRHGNPWDIKRRHYLVPVNFNGRTETYRDAAGRMRVRWVDTDLVMAMACDILVPGYGDDYVTNMRLWAAQSSREFNLETFNQGDYIGAVESKVISENISKVLYPSDEGEFGKELRLKQQYFFVAATLDDILRRYRKLQRSLADLPNFVAIQLNDTHPAIAIPELMRLLMDEEGLGWDEAWTICEKTFAYTNHTILPEALESWPVDLIGRLLPRHMQIIFEINHRFLEAVRSRHPDDPDLAQRVSLITEGETKQVRMAHLAIVGSHTVNGVAALHGEIIKRHLFRDFHRLYPRRLQYVTNGITPRRWLKQVNPPLADLITEAIGPDWIFDLEQLRGLEPLAEDAAFRQQWAAAKRQNKERLARYILRKIGLGVNLDTLFDVQVKRIHEYKRQLLNVMHVITLYNRITDHPDEPTTPRTVIFAGKAAPAYHQAKLIIKLIHSVANTINSDPLVNGRLRVLFLPNYCVSQAEKVIPATELSEQISTAGMEASGTGNMKMTLNGALTIGTMDGANIEIMEAVGAENIFIFGLSSEEVVEKRRKGYDPNHYYRNDGELKRVVDMLATGHFSPQQPHLFAPIVQGLREKGDFYMLMADYRPYITAQDAVDRLFNDSDQWVRRSILNTARMGRFSSDRAVMEYARRIWHVHPLGKEGDPSASSRPAAAPTV